MTIEQPDDHDDMPVDLSALDRAADTPRFELAINAIMRDVAVHRQLGSSSPFAPLVIQLDHWRRTAIAAAAVVSLAAACVLLLIQAAPAPVQPTAANLAAAVGIPQALAAAIENNMLPSTAQLLETFGPTRSAP